MNRLVIKSLIALMWAFFVWLYFSGRADGTFIAAMVLIGAGLTFAAMSDASARSIKFPVLLVTVSAGAFWLFYNDKIDIPWLTVIHLMILATAFVLIFGPYTRSINMEILLTALLFTVTWLSYQESINSYIQLILLYMGINIIMCSSLNLVNGYMGEFNCGHAGPMAIGAYISSLLSVWFFTSSAEFGPALLGQKYALFLFPFCLFVGMIAAAFAGLLIALPSFKTRGDYLAIITIAVNYIIKSTIENVESVGGARGFMGMGKVTRAMSKAPALLGLDGSWDLPWMMIWVFLGTVFTVWVLRRFVSSTYGKGILAVSQDEIAAEIMSVNTNRMKIVAFMLSAALAGLAGGLYAHVVGFVNPGSFTLLKSTEALLMVYLAGMGSLSGSVIAAVLYTLLMEVLRFIIPWIDSALHWAHLIPDGYEVSQVWKWVIIPLLLVLIMQFRPEGLMGNREMTGVYPGLRRFFRFK